ncbi:MAG: hypothetical protein M1812_001054 [Candelaria pacifica]|nr:MAG: hypothetical protein M1812_001054 [Candelaria pacifica]
MIGFGFSAGDIVMAVKFLWKVGEALNDTGKASTEYRQAIQHLQGLLLTLQHLQSADFADTDANVVGTLQTLSASVEKPISVFIHDIKKFEESLGLGDTTNVLVASLRRVQWATRNVKKLEKLGAMIAAQMQAIHVLLGTTILQTQVKSAASGCHNYALLHATAVDHRTHTENLTHQILMARDDYSTTSSRIESNQTVNRELLLVAAHQRTIVADQLRDQISTVAAQIDDLRTCQRERDARLISTITQGAVYAPPEGCGASALCQLNETACVAARADQDLSQGLMQSLRMIALALGNLLRSLLLLAPHIWFALCTLPKLIPRSVSLLLDDCIHFEDVFGMERKLHYAWFQHYEVFEAFLLADFRGKPGEHRIRSKMYLITCHNTRHVNNELSVTSQKSWNENIRPQAKIRMSLAIVGSNVTSRTTFSHRRDVGITAYPDW